MPHRKVVAATVCGAAILGGGSIAITHVISTSNANDCVRAEVLREFIESDAGNKDSAAQRTARAAELRRKLAVQEVDRVQQVVLIKDAERFEASAQASRVLADYWRKVLIPKLESSTCD